VVDHVDHHVGDGQFWEIEDVHYPDPPSRWAVRLFMEGQARGVGEVMEERGLLLQGVRYAEHEGGVYTGFVPLGGKQRRSPPTWLVPVLWRIVPELRRRIRRMQREHHSGFQQSLVSEWLSTGEEALRVLGIDFLDLDLTTLDDGELEHHIDRALVYADGAIKKHFELHGAGISEIGMLAMELVQNHGISTADVSGLFTGLSDTTTGPAAAQQEIVDAAKRVGASSVLANAATLASVRAISSEVDSLVDAYIHNWGRRAIRYETAYPTIAERPGWILDRLKEQLVRPVPEDLVSRHAGTRRLAEERVLAALGDTPDTRERIERARAAFPIREGNETTTVGFPAAVVRLAGLELGRRLRDLELLQDADHVFDLTIAEAVGALVQNADAPDDPSSLAARRNATRMAGRAELPRTFGVPTPPPDLSGFPPLVQHYVEAVIWYASKLSSTAPPRPDADGAAGGGAEPRGSDGRSGHAVVGLGVSPGTYEGPARVVLDESDFEKIKPGDVLVCPITSPVWSMVFPAIGALVCDSGGPLSHPAIIAREFAIPAVVGTGSATAMFSDGSTLRVDGGAGTVTAAG